MHVTVSSVLEFDEEDSQLRFDEPSRRLVLIKHHEFVAMSVDGQPPIRCNLGGKVINVRFSLNHRLAAVQRSDVEIEFMDLLLGNNFTYTTKGCGSKSRFRMLSYQWTGKLVSDFVVITTAGVEFCLVSPETSTVKVVKTIALAVSWCVYSDETCLLLLATGQQDNVLHGVQIQPQAIVRIPKWEAPLAPLTRAPDAPVAAGQQKLRRSLQPCHVQLLRLYNMIICAQIESERQQVILYQLFRDFVVRKYVLSIYSSRAALSVTDDLLIVHALDTKVAMIFDVKINCQYPVTAPLPIATVPTDGFGPLYSSHWQLFAPDLLVDPQAGRVGRLSVDLRAVAASSVDQLCLLQFLLARSAAHEVILELFRRAIDERVPLPALSKLFHSLHSAIESEAAPKGIARAPLGSSVGSSVPGGTTPSSRMPVGEWDSDESARARAVRPTTTSEAVRMEVLVEADRDSASDSMRDDYYHSAREQTDSLSGRYSSEASNSPNVMQLQSASAALEALQEAHRSGTAVEGVGHVVLDLDEHDCVEGGGAPDVNAMAMLDLSEEHVDCEARESLCGGDLEEQRPEVGHRRCDGDVAASTMPNSSCIAPDQNPALSNAAATASKQGSLPRATLSPPAASSPLPADSAPTPSLSASAQLVRVVFVPAAAALPLPPCPRCTARRYLIGALTELLHSLQQHARLADEEAGVLLLSLLADQGSYFQVHQFVQYNTIPDSPRLVAQLFNIALKYPPAASLAVDILRRLGSGANESIIDYLLYQGEVYTACRFIRQQGLLTYPAKPLLDVASKSKDPQVFSTVYGFLLQRNEVWRGHSSFVPEDNCDVHVSRWERECQET